MTKEEEEEEKGVVAKTPCIHARLILGGRACLSLVLSCFCVLLRAGVVLYSLQPIVVAVIGPLWWRSLVRTRPFFQ